jgi:hypothetical protein
MDGTARALQCSSLPMNTRQRGRHADVEIEMPGLVEVKVGGEGVGVGRSDSSRLRNDTLNPLHGRGESGPSPKSQNPASPAATRKDSRRSRAKTAVTYLTRRAAASTQGMFVLATKHTRGDMTAPTARWWWSLNFVHKELHDLYMRKVYDRAALSWQWRCYLFLAVVVAPAFSRSATEFKEVNGGHGRFKAWFLPVLTCLFSLGACLMTTQKFRRSDRRNAYHYAHLLGVLAMSCFFLNQVVYYTEKSLTEFRSTVPASVTFHYGHNTLLLWIVTSFTITSGMIDMRMMHATCLACNGLLCTWIYVGLTISTLSANPALRASDYWGAFKAEALMVSSMLLTLHFKHNKEQHFQVTGCAGAQFHSTSFTMHTNRCPPPARRCCSSTTATTAEKSSAWRTLCQRRCSARHASRSWTNTER